MITCASIADLSCSVPNFKTFSCASVNVIPTRVKALVCHCKTFHIKFQIFIASPCVALKPFCCAIRLFIAGQSTSRLFVCVTNVQSCCNHATCVSSSIIQSFCCATVMSLIALICASVAFVLCFKTVVSFVSCSIENIASVTICFHKATSHAKAIQEAILIVFIFALILSENDFDEFHILSNVALA